MDVQLAELAHNRAMRLGRDAGGESARPVAIGMKYLERL
jgi:hypothetical protein